MALSSGHRFDKIFATTFHLQIHPKLFTYFHLTEFFRQFGRTDRSLNERVVQIVRSSFSPRCFHLFYFHKNFIRNNYHGHHLRLTLNLLVVSGIELILEKSSPLLEAPCRQIGLTFDSSLFALRIFPVFCSLIALTTCQITAIKMAPWMTTNKAKVVFKPSSIQFAVISELKLKRCNFMAPPQTTLKSSRTREKKK